MNDPVDWTDRRLGDVATISSGGTPDSTVERYYGGPIPWVSIADMTASHKYVKSTSKTLTAAGLAASAAKLYDPNVVLYAMYASLGECALALGRVSSSQAILGIKAGPDIDRDFLYYYLDSIKLHVKTIGQHGTQSNLNAGMVRDFRLSLPELDEQLRISTTLSGQDAFIGVLKRFIVKKRAIKQGMQQQLLTARTRLPGFTKAWEFRRVAEMGEVLAGKALNVAGRGVKRQYLRTANVLDGRIDLTDVLKMPMTDAEFEHFSLKRGDVLLNEGQSLGLVGRCSLYKDELGSPCAMQNQLIRFRATEQTSPEFGAQLFRNCQASGIFASIATQTTSVAHLGSLRFSNLRLLWPIDRCEQSEIAAVLDDSDREIDKLESRLVKARAIRHGLMQQLLTGRTRLPVEAIP